MARKKREDPGSAGAPWLNTFADLMNLLLCFFVLLFAASTVDAEKYEKIVVSLAGDFSIFSSGGSSIENGNLISSGISQLNNLDDYYSNMGEVADDSGDEIDETDPLDKLLEEKKKASQAMYDDISDLSDKYNLGNYMELSIDPNFQFVKISLSGSVLFDSGKADIKTEALPIFSKVGDILKIYNDYQIELEGHTDNVPISNSNYPNNNWLSSARALNAATYLIEEKGLNPKTLQWSGRGEYDPISSNSTKDGRSKNRRVEIKIFNEINKK